MTRTGSTRAAITVQLMTENTPEQDPHTPTEIARQPWRTSERPGRRWLIVAIVAVVSLALGAGGVLLALRYGWLAAPEHAAGHASEAPAQGAASSGAQDMSGMPGMGSAPPTRPTGASDRAIYISPARQQMIGVRTAPVTHEALDTTIRTMGVLAYDETRTTMVHTKVAGWVDREYVNFVGQPVRRGQALFTVYSPDLVATQNEYLLALRAQAQLGSSQITETRSSAASLLAATRERLKLWDITDAQIAELERTREPRKNVTIYAPFDGVVLERDAFAGQYITPDMNTFKVADLSTIWVIAQILRVRAAPGRHRSERGRGVPVRRVRTDDLRTRRFHLSRHRPPDASRPDSYRVLEPRPRAQTRVVRHGDAQNRRQPQPRPAEGGGDRHGSEADRDPRAAQRLFRASGNHRRLAQ